MKIIIGLFILVGISIGLVLRAGELAPIETVGGAVEDALLREYINSTAKETICDVDTLMTFINASAAEKTTILENFRAGKLSTITTEIQELDAKKLELQSKANVLTK